MTGTIDKVGVAVLREGRILLVRNADTRWLLVPGGRREGDETDTETLRREIREELGCTLDAGSVHWLGEFSDSAANDPGRTVRIRLYGGEIRGTAVCQSEVAEVVWHQLDQDDERLSAIVRSQILPFLRTRLAADAKQTGIVRQPK